MRSNSRKPPRTLEQSHNTREHATLPREGDAVHSTMQRSSWPAAEPYPIPYGAAARFSPAHELAGGRRCVMRLAGVDEIGTGGRVVIAALKAAPNSGLRRARRASELASDGRGLPLPAGRCAPMATTNSPYLLPGVEYRRRLSTHSSVVVYQGRVFSSSAKFF